MRAWAGGEEDGSWRSGAGRSGAAAPAPILFEPTPGPGGDARALASMPAAQTVYIFGLAAWWPATPAPRARSSAG